MNLHRVAAALVATVALAPLVSGQNITGQTGSYFLRGKVAVIQADQITVVPHTGGVPVSAPLVAGWTAAYINPADERIVAVGNLVNIVETDQPDGISWALHVDLLAARDTPSAIPQGRTWSQIPGRDEFGAWGTLGRIASVEKNERGLLVEIAWPEGRHRQIIPPGTPMVVNEPGDASIVKPGENVAVILQKGPDGKPFARRVLVGSKGTVPPM